MQKKICEVFRANLRLPWVFTLVPPPSQFHPFNKTILAYLVAVPTRSTNLCGVERGGTKVNTHGKEVLKAV